MFSLSHSLTFMVLNQLQPSTMPETHSPSYPRDTSWPKSAKDYIENLVDDVKRSVAKAAAPEEGSAGLISISGIILTFLGASGILAGSTGSRLFTASSFRGHKAMYISFYTVYALDLILPIISILLCVIKPYSHRPLHIAAACLVGGSLILLVVVLPLGACAQFISSDQTLPPPPPPPGLLHHQLKRIPGS